MIGRFAQNDRLDTSLSINMREPYDADSLFVRGYNVMKGSAIMTLTLIIFMFLTSALIAVSAIYTAR
jgi:hypothetical protein